MFLIILGYLVSVAACGVVLYFTNAYTQVWAYPLALLAAELLFLILFGLFLGFLFVSSKLLSKKEPNKPNKRLLSFINQVITELFFVLRVRIKKIGFEKVRKDKRYLVIYNHTSNFDPMVIMPNFKDLICVTKPENMSFPIAGPYIRKAGFISINRDNDSEGIKSILKAIDYMQKDNCSICISPEGTRSKTGELLPFKAGVFNIAKRAECDIVLIGLKGVSEIKNKAVKQVSHVEMNVIDVVTFDNIKELSTSEISSNIYNQYKNYLGD